MIVVSNTSPLTNLAAIGQFDLLHRLYGSIHLIPKVRPLLLALRNTAGFWLADSVFYRVLDLAGEQD
jgi:predicted nucleic acid-binding protein